jgi:hypothetical protein
MANQEYLLMVYIAPTGQERHGCAGIVVQFFPQRKRRDRSASQPCAKLMRSFRIPQGSDTTTRQSPSEILESVLSQESLSSPL